MGLSLYGVSKDYNGDLDLVEEIYGSVDIGYIGWKIFKDDLLKFCSDAKWTSIDDNLDGSKLTSNYYNIDTYQVAMIGNFEDKELKNKGVIEYLEKLDYLKNNYPKVYAIFPLIAHCDCEGEMSYSQLESILPILKEYNSYCKENNIKYGYSAWDYDFLSEFIDIVEQVIDNKGKLIFS